MRNSLSTNLLVASVIVATVSATSVGRAVSLDEQDALGQSVSSPTMGSNEYDPVVPKELFGARGGYFHPFISATALYSDNIHNSTTKTSDWRAIYSPGIWLAAPAAQHIVLNLSTDNTAPGGLLRGVEKSKRFGRYQTYAMYVADIDDYLDHSDMDNVKQSAEGFFQFNLRGGLSVDMFDKYSNSHDPVGTTDATVLDKYKSNLFGMAADYDVTEKILFRADYTNLDLNYDRPESEGRDRTDNSLSGALYYKYSEKTSVFAQYKFVDLAYKTNGIHDNQQHYTYVGIDWKPTGKTTLKGKVGLAVRDANLAVGDTTEPVGELSADYKMTGKTTVQLSLSQRMSESGYTTSEYSMDKGITLAMLTQFTEKISGRVQFGVMKSEFEGGISDRDDDLSTASLVGTYAFKEWLKGEAGYQFTDRDSTLGQYDYTTNELYVRLSAGF